MSSSARAWKSDTTFQNLLSDIEDARDVTLAARDEILNDYGSVAHLGHEVEANYHLGVWKVDPAAPDVLHVKDISQDAVDPGYNSILSDLTNGDLVFNLNSTFVDPPVTNIRSLTEHVNVSTITDIESGYNDYNLVRSEWVQYDGIKKDLTTYGSEVFFLLETWAY